MAITDRERQEAVEMIASLRKQGNIDLASQIEAVLHAEREKPKAPEVPSDLRRKRMWSVDKSVRLDEPIVPEGTDIEAWCWSSLVGGNVRYCVAAFAGKSAKPERISNYYYRSAEERDRKLAELAQGRRAYFAHKDAEQKARREFKHSYKVGDILCSSWGYDQTNIDFYQVVGVRGQMIDLKEIMSQDVESTGWASGTVVAVPDAFKGGTISCKAGEHGLKVGSQRWARLWDGKPRSWSGYA